MTQGRRARPVRGGIVVAASIAAALCALPVAGQMPDLQVVDRADGQQLELDDLVGRLAAADVLLVGVTAGDAVAHRGVARLLEALAARRTDVALALEAFDRQAQEPLDHFQMGHLSEAELMADVARPRPDYARDYRTIVDGAIARGWSIVAAALPRPVAEAVAANGLAALEVLPAGTASVVASRHTCGEVGPPGAPELPGPHASVAICLENETLAESVAQAYAAGSIGGRRPLVAAVVDNGRLGHLTRFVGDVARRLGGRQIIAVATVSLDAGEALPPANDLALPRLAIYVRR